MQRAENILCNSCLLNRVFSESQLPTNSCNKENYEKIVYKAQMLFGYCFPTANMLLGKKKNKEEINIKERSTVVSPAVYVTYSVNGGIILLLVSETTAYVIDKEHYLKS